MKLARRSSLRVADVLRLVSRQGHRAMCHGPTFLATLGTEFGRAGRSRNRFGVRASAYAQKTVEAPSSVTIITAEQIRKHADRSLSDILRGVGAST